jgi:hypothetical protein
MKKMKIGNEMYRADEEIDDPHAKPAFPPLALAQLPPNNEYI